jgi:hypothetical protein
MTKRVIGLVIMAAALGASAVWADCGAGLDDARACQAGPAGVIDRRSATIESTRGLQRCQRNGSRGAARLCRAAERGGLGGCVARPPCEPIAEEITS